MADCFQVTTTPAQRGLSATDLEQATEWYCNLKTTKAQLAEIVTIADADAAYLQWIEAEVESR